MFIESNKIQLQFIVLHYKNNVYKYRQCFLTHRYGLSEYLTIKEIELRKASNAKFEGNLLLKFIKIYLLFCLLFDSKDNVLQTENSNLNF